MTIPTVNGQPGYQLPSGCLDGPMISALLNFFAEGINLDPSAWSAFIEQAGSNKLIQAIEAMEIEGQQKIEDLLFSFFSNRCPGIVRGDQLSRAQKDYNRREISGYFARNDIGKIIDELTQACCEAGQLISH